MCTGLRGVIHCFVRCIVATSGLCILICVGSVHAASTTPQPRSPAEYRDHLRVLDQLIAQCQQHTDASHCNADAVGPDDIVTASEHAKPRLIPYGWLRQPMELIGTRKISPADAKALLKDAAQRIQLEESEAPGRFIVRPVRDLSSCCGAHRPCRCPEHARSSAMRIARSHSVCWRR